MTELDRDWDRLPIAELHQLDALCDRFERAAAGDPDTRVEPFVDGLVPPQQRLLVRELVQLEIEKRHAVGDTPSPDEYAQRFPQWSDELRELTAQCIEDLESGSNAAKADTIVTHAVTDNDTKPSQSESGAPSPWRASAAELSRSGLPDDGTLNHYQLQSVIGRGGMGLVLRAHDTKLARDVAIKILAPGVAHDARTKQRFLREARAVALIRHNHVVTIYAVEESGGIPFLAMELVEGTNLEEYRRTSGELTVGEIVSFAHQIAQGLAAAHRQGLIHRDVKPANILLEKNDQHGSDSRSLSSWQVKLTDFGLARIAAEVPLTSSGTIVGTPQFMSPEQATGQSVDSRSDLFSLGSVMYAMCAGRAPFEADSAVAIARQVADKPARSLREVHPETPEWLIGIIEKLMAKSPDERFQSAADVAQLLARHVDDLRAKRTTSNLTTIQPKPIDARPPTIANRLAKLARRHRARLLTAAAVIGLLVAGAAVVSVLLREANEQNLSRRTMTAVNAMGTARGAIVPHAIRDLSELPEQLVRSELEREFETAENPRRLPLAFALAQFDDVRVEFLVSQVGSAAPDEFENFVAALSRSKVEAEAALKSAARDAERSGNWRHQVRLAVLALRLDSPALARQVCRLSSDPSKRTYFIAEWSLLLGDLNPWPRLLLATDDPDVVSALCCALGRIADRDIAGADQPIPSELADHLSELYLNAASAAVHSAAGWALRRCGKLDLPAIELTRKAPPNQQWFVNRRGMTMLKISTGDFTMGDDVTGPMHPVKLTKDFFMCDREVSVRDFEAFRRDGAFQQAHYPGEVRELFTSVDSRVSPTVDCPVQNVSWYGAVVFCNWLSQQEQRSLCYTLNRTNSDSPVIVACDFDADGYRLPTEAEWAYACRARSQAAYTFGDDEGGLDEYGYCIPNSMKRAWPCGQKLPNGFGLFDMHGNVWEWCWDWFGDYQPGPVVDPTGPEHGDWRGAVMRGGGWWVHKPSCRSAYREYRVRGHQVDSIGFRVVASSMESLERRGDGPGVANVLSSLNSIAESEVGVPLDAGGRDVSRHGDAFQLDPAGPGYRRGSGWR